MSSTKFKAEDVSDSKTGFAGLVGYALNENVAFEATVRRLSSENVGGSDVKVNALQVSVLGLGAAYQVNNNFSVRAEYADLGSNKIEAGGFSTKVKISQFNVGVNYAF